MLNRVVVFCHSSLQTAKNVCQRSVEISHDFYEKAKVLVYGFCVSVVGDFKAANEESDKEFRTLNETNKDFLRVKKIGRLGYHAAFIATSAAQIEKMLGQLDKHPKGRIAYQTLDHYSKGFFMFSHTGPKAEQYRKLIMTFLSAQRAADITREVSDNVLKTQPKFDPNMMKTISRTVVARLIFGVENLPPELNYILSDLYIYGFHSMGHLMPSALMLKTDFVRAQQDYAIFIKKFLDEQLPKIVEEFKRYPDFKNPNLILAALVEEIKKDYGVKKDGFEKYLHAMPIEKIKRYLHRSEFLRTTPLIFQGTESLADALNYFVNQFLVESSAYVNWMKRANRLYPHKKFPTLFALFRYEMEETFKLVNGVPVDLDMLNQSELLSAIVDECIRQQRPPNVIRYTQKEMKLDGMHIPAHTMLNIILSEGTPFGANPRACPAGSSNSKVAIAIFKTVVATIACGYVPLKKKDSELSDQLMLLRDPNPLKSLARTSLERKRSGVSFWEQSPDENLQKCVAIFKNSLLKRNLTTANEFDMFLGEIKQHWAGDFGKIFSMLREAHFTFKEFFELKFEDRLLVLKNRHLFEPPKDDPLAVQTNRLFIEEDSGFTLPEISQSIVDEVIKSMSSLDSPRSP